MKATYAKYLTLAALLIACACAFVACKTEVDTLPEEAISFRSHATDTTEASASRAVIESNSDLQRACSTGGEAIAIWGVVNDDANLNSLIFDNTALTFSEATGWGYTPTRYWIHEARHDFWALYPQPASGLSFNPEEELLEWADIELGTDNNIDVMSATATRDLSVEPTNFSPVALPMTHHLSLLEFRFVNASDSNVSSIGEVSLDGLFYRGVLEVSLAAGGKVFVDESERVAEGAGRYVGRCSATNIPVNISTHYNLFEDHGSVVVMPQYVNKQPIYFNIDVAGVRSRVNLGQMSTAIEWEPGKKYIYTLTRTTSEITFDVNVVDWVDDMIELE